MPKMYLIGHRWDQHRLICKNIDPSKGIHDCCIPGRGSLGFGAPWGERLGWKRGEGK